MTTMQRIIKYLALAFATFLIITIVSSIFWGVYLFSSVLNLRDSKNNETLAESGEFMEIYGGDISHANILDIELKASKLTIKNGNNFKVETNSKYVKFLDKGNGIVIKEDSHSFWRADISETVIYIPSNITFEKANIETGAGEINIESINSRDINFKMGAGKVTIGSIKALESCRIEGGAGQVDILSGDIHNLKLDMGVGKFTLNSSLYGNSKIESGIGKLDINLDGDKESYQIKAEKGIGSINIDGKSVSNESIYGSGSNYIKIDGGIGSIDIRFNDRI